MSIESIRKGCLFCQKWYIEGEGVGLRAVSLYNTLLRKRNKTNFRVAVSANLFATFSEFFSSPHSLHVPYFVHIVDDVQDILKEHNFGNEFSAHPSIRAIAEENRRKNAVHNFNFKYTNKTQVEKLLSNINALKACGHDTITPRLLKESASANLVH